MEALAKLRLNIGWLVESVDAVLSGAGSLSWTGPRADRFRVFCGRLAFTAATACAEASAVHTVAAGVLGGTPWLPGVRGAPTADPGAPGVFFHPSLAEWWVVADSVHSSRDVLGALPDLVHGCVADLLHAIDVERSTRIDAVLAAGLPAPEGLLAAPTARLLQTSLVDDLRACARAVADLSEASAAATPLVAAANAPLGSPVLDAIAELDRLAAVPEGWSGVARRREALHALLRPDVDGRTRRFLELDLGGDGRIVEVVGDLENATAVAVLVPGAGTTLDNYDTVLAENARRLYAAAPGIAVVTGLVYDPPGVAGAPFDGRAEDGAAGLAELLASLDVPDGADVVVVAHSYGALVVTEWLRRFPEQAATADRVVFLGAAGGGAVSTLPPEVEYFEACAAGDVVCGSVLGVPTAYWHGDAPLTGAAAVATEDSEHEPSEGHSEYFTGAALAALAAVVSRDDNAADGDP